MQSQSLSVDIDETIDLNKNFNEIIENMNEIVMTDYDDQIGESVQTSERELINNEIKTKENLMILFINQVKHNFTNSAVVDNALSTNFVCGKNIYPLSYQTLSKKADIFQPIIEKYFYCDCSVIGPIDSHLLNKSTICKKICKKVIVPQNEIKNGYFCYIKLSDYLQYTIPHIYEFLRFIPASNKYLHDINNGSEYLRISNVETLTIYFGFDGVTFDEKGNSFWPLVIFISELPFHLRTKFCFPIGIHSGKNQPNSNMLQPLIDEFKFYEKEKLSFQININGIIVEKQYYIKLLFGICDSPARSKILNLVQHNGYYGCNICTILPYRSKKYNGVMTYPMCTQFEVRDTLMWKEIANKLVSGMKDFNTFGVKGPTPLMELEYIDLSSFLPPEVMHSQYLGTVKLMFDNWLGLKKNQVRKLSSSNIKLINNRIDLIKFPTSVLRKIGEFSNKSNLKSIDYENILFYGIVAF